jgi:peptidoglycan/LPS O-acetylase OafA/YrhL
MGYLQSMSLIRWREGLWAMLVLVAAAVIACGLADVFTFLIEPATYAVGHRLVLLGSVAFAGAALWAWLRRGRRWVTVLTALPAVVVGGLALQFDDGTWGVLAGYFLIPAALVAMLVELISPYAGGRRPRITQR